MKRRDFTAGAATGIIAFAASFFGGTAKGKDPDGKKPKKPKKAQPKTGQILDEGWAIIHPARPDGDDNGLNGPLAGWVELNYFSQTGDCVDEIVRVNRRPGCYAVPVQVVSCGKPKPEPKDTILTITLDGNEQSRLVIWLNMELRSCASTPQLGKTYATTLNSIFRKLTGHDHKSFAANKHTLKD